MVKYESDGLNKFGDNPDVDIGVQESIWFEGGLYVWPTSARLHDIVSDNLNDALLGTGAHTVTIQGIGANGLDVTETVELDGTTPKETTNTYLAINRMFVISAGSSGTNIGTISATAQVDATVSATIGVAKGQTLQAVYMVPSDKDLFLTKYYAGIGQQNTGAVDVELYVRPPDGVFQIKHTLDINSQGSTYTCHNFMPLFKVAAGSQIDLRGTSSANNVEVTGGFEGDFSTPADV